MRTVVKLMLMFLFILHSPFGVVAKIGGNSDITLVSGEKSDYVIIVPDKDQQNRVRKAAELLQSILAESTGCKLPIVKESASPANKPHIYLGRTDAAQKAGIPFDKLKDWTFCKRKIGKNIYLTGNDASANLKGGLSHHDREYLLKLGDERLNQNIKDRSYKCFMGTYKAVSSFLEKQVGVRFLLPGPNGLHVPKHNTLKVSDSINFLGSARIPFCYGRCYGDVSIPNNHNEIPYYRNYGGHSFGPAVPRRKYAKTHPEYYVLVNGKRQPAYGPGGAGHLCISNPEVQELMMKELERQYDIGFKWVQIGQTDGCVHCQCEKCKELAKKSYGDALWQVYRKIAIEMKKRRPGLKIVFLAYADTKYPPQSFDSFPDNVVVELCELVSWPNRLAQWKKFNVPKLVYIYNWGTWRTIMFAPKHSPAYCAKQLRLFAENNIQGIFKCGWGEALGLEGPVYYVYSKLLFDPYADPQKIADDFYHAAYGKAYAPMKKFFDELYRRMDFKNGDSVVDLMAKRPHHVEEQMTYLFQPVLILFMEKMLNRALTMDKDPKVQARLKLVKREFDYLKNLISIYIYHDAFRLSNSRFAFNALDAEMKKRDKLIDSWYDKNGKMIQEPGFNWPFFTNVSKNVLKNGGGAIPCPYPGLRIEKLREKIYSGDSKTNSFKAAHLRSLNDRNEFFNQHDPGNPASATLDDSDNTVFNVGYDNKNLYFSFSCKFPNIKNAVFSPVGQDGKCQNQECMEILLSPTGNTKKYYRFAFNPVKNSFYEGRCGFSDDPLNPNFGKEDKSWNGKWQYSPHIISLAKIQCWTANVTIPFKTLGVSAPKPGDEWGMNIVQWHYPAQKGKNSSYKFLSWQPDQNKNNCGVPDTFGRLEFK